MVKNLPANAGDADFNPGPGRTPGGGNGNPLQYPNLGNSMDSGDLWARVYVVTKSQTPLSMCECMGMSMPGAPRGTCIHIMRSAVHVNSSA